MKTIFASASALALVALLSTGASATEARHNGMLVGKTIAEQSTLSGFQALGQATYSDHNTAVKQVNTDPARSAFSGR